MGDYGSVDGALTKRVQTPTGKCLCRESAGTVLRNDERG
jgi:hypothetical protein